MVCFCFSLKCQKNLTDASTLKPIFSLIGLKLFLADLIFQPPIYLKCLYSSVGVRPIYLKCLYSSVCVRPSLRSKTHFSPLLNFNSMCPKSPSLWYRCTGQDSSRLAYRYLSSVTNAKSSLKP